MTLVKILLLISLVLQCVIFYRLHIMSKRLDETGRDLASLDKDLRG